MNTNTATRFSSRFSAAGEHRGQRDHHAREVHLAHERLAVDDRGHRAPVASWKN